jgi:hypothetical protein
MHLFSIKKGTLLYSELHDERRMLLHRTASAPEVALQHRFVDGLVTEEVCHRYVPRVNSRDNTSV